VKGGVWVVLCEGGLGGLGEIADRTYGTHRTYVEVGLGAESGRYPTSHFSPITFHLSQDEL
jgi:hypothetical protein